MYKKKSIGQNHYEIGWFVTLSPKAEAPSSFCAWIGDDKDAFGNNATTERIASVMDIIWPESALIA